MIRASRSRRWSACSTRSTTHGSTSISSPGKVVVAPVDQLIADVAYEAALGPDDPASLHPGIPPAVALSYLADSIIRIASLNSDPRQIVEYVVHRLDGADVEAVRREQRK